MEHRVGQSFAPAHASTGDRGKALERRVQDLLAPWPWRVGLLMAQERRAERERQGLTGGLTPPRQE